MTVVNLSLTKNICGDYTYDVSTGKIENVCLRGVLTPGREFIGTAFCACEFDVSTNGNQTGCLNSPPELRILGQFLGGPFIADNCWLTSEAIEFAYWQDRERDLGHRLSFRPYNNISVHLTVGERICYSFRDSHSCYNPEPFSKSNVTIEH